MVICCAVCRFFFFGGDFLDIIGDRGEKFTEIYVLEVYYGYYGETFGEGFK